MNLKLRKCICGNFSSSLIRFQAFHAMISSADELFNQLFIFLLTINLRTLVTTFYEFFTAFYGILKCRNIVEKNDFAVKEFSAKNRSKLSEDHKLQ